MAHQFIQAAGAVNVLRVSAWCAVMTLCAAALADQSVDLNGDAGGKPFEGIGAVSGGGTALFDNLIVNTLNGPAPPTTEFKQNSSPIYEP